MIKKIFETRSTNNTTYYNRKELNRYSKRFQFLFIKYIYILFDSITEDYGRNIDCSIPSQDATICIKIVDFYVRKLVCKWIVRFPDIIKGTVHIAENSSGNKWSIIRKTSTLYYIVYIYGVSFSYKEFGSMKNDLEKNITE